MESRGVLQSPRAPFPPVLLSNFSTRIKRHMPYFAGFSVETQERGKHACEAHGNVGSP